MAPVTLRQIANQMNISQGNLNYHFRKREDIVQALYEQLVARLDAQFSQMTNAAPSMALLYQSSLRSMELLLEYRFLMLDFVHVMRTHPAILSHFRKLRQFRDMQFKTVFNFLIATGRMQREEFPNQYQNLLFRFNILGDFWISSAEIHSDLPNEEKPRHFTNILMESIYPLLTEKGKAEFLEMRKIK